jgi:hypothetical protein
VVLGKLVVAVEVPFLEREGEALVGEEFVVVLVKGDPAGGQD